MRMGTRSLRSRFPRMGRPPYDSVARIFMACCGRQRPCGTLSKMRSGTRSPRSRLARVGRPPGDSVVRVFINLGGPSGAMLTLSKNRFRSEEAGPAGPARVGGPALRPRGVFHQLRRHVDSLRSRPARTEVAGSGGRSDADIASHCKPGVGRGSDQGWPLVFFSFTGEWRRAFSSASQKK